MKKNMNGKNLGMKRQYTRNIKCSIEGCNEYGYYTFNTHRELMVHYNKTSTWTCVRHNNPSEVLSPHNVNTSAKLICKLKLTEDGRHLGKFWQEEKDLETEKVSSGFQFGNGYKAWANDFPEGTEILITASVCLPNSTTHQAPQPPIKN